MIGMFQEEQMVTMYPIAKETRANCFTLETFLRRFVAWRTKKPIAEPMKWPTDKRIEELRDDCFRWQFEVVPGHKGDTRRVSLNVEECEVAPIKVLVLLILQFALPAIVFDGEDEYVNHRYFTEKALDEQWGRVHEIMIVMLPHLVSASGAPAETNSDVTTVRQGLTKFQNI